MIILALNLLVFSTVSASASFENTCNALPFQSVYKWDICFAVEGYDSFDSLVNSCNQMSNGRLATGLTTAQLTQVINDINANDGPYIDDQDTFSIFYHKSILDTGDIIELAIRITDTVDSLTISFQNGDGSLKAVQFYFDFAGTQKQVDSLTCAKNNGPDWYEQLLDAGFVSLNEFKVKIDIQADSYEVSIDGVHKLSCVRGVSLTPATIVGLFEGSNAAAFQLDYVTWNGHFYPVHSLLWLNLVKKASVWIWESGKSSIQALESDTLWASNSDNGQNCAVLSADSGQVSGAACNNKAHGLCMYEPNYKRFSYSKSSDKSGDPLSQVSSSVYGSKSMCLHKCNKFALCRSVDYNPNNNMCNFYSNYNNTQANGYELYEKI